LKGRRVRFTATAQRHVEQERTWWLKNRDYRDLFATELEAATQLMAVLPGAGTPYAHARVSGIRRLYLRHLACASRRKRASRSGSVAKTSGRIFRRDVAIEFAVPRPIDLAHPAGPEQRDDFVRPEPSASGQRHELAPA
jgi:hypothetical protein